MFGFEVFGFRLWAVWMMTCYLVLVLVCFSWNGSKKMESWVCLDFIIGRVFMLWHNENSPVHRFGKPGCIVYSCIYSCLFRSFSFSSSLLSFPYLVLCVWTWINSSYLIIIIILVPPFLSSIHYLSLFLFPLPLLTIQ